MAILIAVGAALLLLTLYCLRRCVISTRRRRVLRAGFSGLGGLLFAALLTGFVLLATSYYGYQRLTDEQSVAKIEFTRVGQDEFRARLMIDGRTDRFFVLSGNEWQIDARMVSWKPPATILGLDPVYRLDRLSGRYADLDDERTRPRTVHGLSDSTVLDVWEVARQVPEFLPGIDAYYGTATYLPMVDGGRFDVSLSRDALIARPANQAAEEAVGLWRQ